MASLLRTFMLNCIIAVGLTYGSLVVPGRVTAICGNLGTPVYCPVLAYGFPIPFIADNQGISPVGSVGRDPFWLFFGEDDLLWHRMAISAVFWLLMVLLGRWAWRRRARR